MKKLLVPLGIGIIAGIIDVIPMIIQGLDWYSNISAFIFWIVMGFIITHISLPVKNWLKGMIVALICAIPIMIIVSMNGILTIIPILVMTLILGSLVGYATGKYVK